MRRALLAGFCLVAFTTADAAAQSPDAAVAFGTRHAVALRTHGDVLTRGDNVSCQLGRAAGNTGRIVDALATYDLTNLRPGNAADAMRVKANPVLPDPAQANRIQMIAITFSLGPKPAGAQLEWETKVKESFDFGGLAALLQRSGATETAERFGFHGVGAVPLRTKEISASSVPPLLL